MICTCLSGSPKEASGIYQPVRRLPELRPETKTSHCANSASPRDQTHSCNIHFLRKRKLEGEHEPRAYPFVGEDFFTSFFCLFPFFPLTACRKTMSRVGREFPCLFASMIHTLRLHIIQVGYEKNNSTERITFTRTTQFAQSIDPPTARYPCVKNLHSSSRKRSIWMAKKLRFYMALNFFGCKLFSGHRVTFFVTGMVYYGPWEQPGAYRVSRGKNSLSRVHDAQ